MEYYPFLPLLNAKMISSTIYLNYIFLPFDSLLRIFPLKNGLTAETFAASTIDGDYGIFSLNFTFLDQEKYVNRKGLSDLHNISLYRTDREI